MIHLLFVAPAEINSISSTTRNDEFPNVPDKSLLRGLWTGPIPEELQDLTSLETSMISIYSPVTKLTLQGGQYYHAKGGTTYVVVNDLTSIALQLPFMPTQSLIAVLRVSKPNQTQKDYKYRPYYVKRALLWLKQHNFLYKDIDLVFPKLHENVSWESRELIDCPSIPLSDDDIQCIEEDMNALPTVSINTGSSGTETEILLLGATTMITQLEEIQKACLTTSIQQNPNVIIRDGNLQFVNPINSPEYYMAKCFPQLFPYGRGCPSDKNCKLQGYGEHAAHLLRRGGKPQGRRAQWNNKYIFLNYTLEMKRRIRGVTYSAQRSHLDDNHASLSPPTVVEVNEMLRYLQETDCKNITHQLSNTSSTNIYTENVDENTKIRRLINRLVPYSEVLKGSQTYISNERKKLLSMVSSPLITAQGSWRWFLTCAPADVYDHKIFDILIDDVIDNQPNHEIPYDIRHSKVQIIISKIISDAFTYIIFITPSLSSGKTINKRRKDKLSTKSSCNSSSTV